MAYAINVRNVNEALNKVMALAREEHNWRKVSPRGMETMEWKGTFITEYEHPDERVLFSASRDANPYFHFFESLWILAGMKDVETLAQFNPKMRDYSDNGLTFHAPYGHRLRYSHIGDQIMMAIKQLRSDQDTRQVVLTIWDPARDFCKVSKDIPCNDMLFLKIRDGKLNLTSCCRSNDIIWGAYGANAVQFSMIQEFMARSLGVDVGVYTQVSDSFHIYTDNDAYKRLQEHPRSADLYGFTAMRPFPIMNSANSAEQWLRQLEEFTQDPAYVEDHVMNFDPFFVRVALPMWESWSAWKVKDVGRAIEILDGKCEASDWSSACQQWLLRRITKKAAA